MSAPLPRRVGTIPDKPKKTGPISTIFPDGRIVVAHVVFLEDKKKRKADTPPPTRIEEEEDDDVIYRIDVVGHERCWEYARVYGKRQVESAKREHKLSPGDQFRVTGLHRRPA